MIGDASAYERGRRDALAEARAAIEALPRYTPHPGVNPFTPFLSSNEYGSALKLADVLVALDALRKEGT